MKMSYSKWAALQMKMNYSHDSFLQIPAGPLRERREIKKIEIESFHDKVKNI